MPTLMPQAFPQLITLMSFTESIKKVSNIIRKMKINGKETERFNSFFDAVKWVMEKKQCSNQEATHFVWDNQFTMGTDRAIWITV
jgi:hypothetical protein